MSLDRRKQNAEIISNETLFKEKSIVLKYVFFETVNQGQFQKLMFRQHKLESLRNLFRWRFVKFRSWVQLEGG